MPAKTKTLPVVCPFCGDADATLSLDINDVSRITCSFCDEVFTAQQAYEKAAAAAAWWASIAEWVANAPIE